MESQLKNKSNVNVINSTNLEKVERMTENLCGEVKVGGPGQVRLLAVDDVAFDRTSEVGGVEEVRELAVVGIAAEIFGESFRRADLQRQIVEMLNLSSVWCYLFACRIILPFQNVYTILSSNLKLISYS